MSQLNGSLDSFKTKYANAIKEWYRAFDRITERGRLPICDSVQGRLHAVCRDDNEEQALLIYLVEERKLPVALVLREIKEPYRRLSLDLRRTEGRLVPA